MSLNAHTDIELTPTATKVPVPFVAVLGADGLVEGGLG